MGRRDQARRAGENQRTAVRILLVDDDTMDRERLAAIVRSDVVPVEIEEISEHVRFFQVLRNPDFDLAIVEQDLQWSSGTEALTAIKSVKPSLPVIMVARRDDEAIAASAFREGLDAYVPKSGELATRLRSSIRAALQKMEMADRAESVESRLQDLFDRLNVGVFRTTMEGRFLEANAAFLRLLGIRSLKTLKNYTVSDLFVDVGVRRGFHTRLDQDGQVRDFQVEFRRQDGSTVWVSLTETVQTSLTGEGVIDGLVEDSTLARQTQEAVRRANEDYRVMFEINSAATVILEEDSTITIVNSSFENMSGFSRDDLEGKRSLVDFVADADVGRVREKLALARVESESIPQRTRFDFVNREGRTLHVLATLAPLPNAGRTVVSMLNLTQRQRAEEQLIHNAFHDGLTGLPNRLSLLDRIESLLSRTRPRDAGNVALVLLGLDRFRKINDCLGHRIGDLLLKAVTRRIERALPSADTMARCSGDVFGIVLHPVRDPAAATSAAEKVAAALSDPFTFGEHTVYCTASFGVATSRATGDASALYRDAEAAMYECKRTARGRCVVFDPVMSERSRRSFTIENDLRRALANHEFLLHFQPIGTIADGRVLGFESLVRWRRPDGNVVLPDSFLQVAEDTGLIVPIGREVIQLACRQLGTWRSPGNTQDEPFASVNLSGRQLRQRDFVAEVRDAIRTAGIDSTSLMFEISEAVLNEEIPADASVLKQLREMGIQLCVDSFGTGGLSLALLHRYPFSTVKVDRSFLAGIGDDTARWRMLDGLVALAVNVGMRVIVEGIEHRDQLHRLVEMGCDLGQGNLLSAAVDEHGAGRLLRVQTVW